MGTQFRKTIAATAIAGAAVGFGALFAAAPMASADTTNDDGWWLGSGNANGNNTIFGQAGAGNSNQFGNFNGNIQNNQLNALSPVIGGNAVQTNATTNTNTQTTTSAETSALNGDPLALGLSAGNTTPATALPLGGALAGNLGAGTGGTSAPNTGLNGATQTPTGIPVTTGGVNLLPILPILSQVNPTGPGTVTNTVSPSNSATSGEISGPVSSGGVGAAGDPDATNVQVAGARASNTNTTSASSSGGNTSQRSTVTGGTINNNTTNNATGHNAANEANNSSNNNTSSGNGTGSPTSIGNNH